ncbi:threonine aldolase family protein [Sphingobacterium deserti]|uniref:Threonine aldolase n=1 Tax=Sphingobacterium deserti TaxID=1229276 RepID=A0A0B8TAP2_9SPHI|nr:aminotransferase class I/II-fold pyridoxal phosphate-dependent enzyme [Sphingobacterium deserti]KGE15954.1 threonine aldolase [Sphingobacterium deserti]
MRINKALEMYNFKNDYAEGAHPKILERLAASNFDQELGYGDDRYTLAAKQVLYERLQNPKAVLYFVSGGTQANLLVISHLLRPHEAVISCKTGHIYANETGAIEATGHRVITVDGVDGKVTPTLVKEVIDAHQLRPHVVKPRMLYISNSTELGTIYTKSELISLSIICKKHGLLLFMDGARLGHALMSSSNDLSLADIAAHVDIFYIGGTKNGALLGEAIVFKSKELAADFDYTLKQKGALLAKGRILGIQFLTLLEEDLYFELAAKANTLATQIAQTIAAQGYQFLTPPNTNQLFPILPKNMIKDLLNSYAFYIWKEIDDDFQAIRIITSWASDQQEVDRFCHDLKRLADAKQ